MQLYKMTGEIPKEIGALTNLQEMALISNNFTGQVPTVIGNMTKLQKLYLGANKLTGKFKKKRLTCKLILEHSQQGSSIVRHAGRWSGRLLLCADC